MEKSADNSNYALEQLRALIVLVHLTNNDKLPTERDLVERLGVSRRSIRRALEVLEAEGSSGAGKGRGLYWI